MTAHKLQSGVTRTSAAAPAEHEERQTVAPTPLVPKGHAVHERDPATALNDPASHTEQLGDSVVHAPLVPAGQTEPHVAAPGLLHDPLGHAEHAPVVAS